MCPLYSGGHDGSNYLNSVECYDPKADQWSSKVAPTGCCRTSVGVAVLGGCVYAVGGQDGLACLSLVERYAITACLILSVKQCCVDMIQNPTNGTKSVP